MDNNQEKSNKEIEFNNLENEIESALVPIENKINFVFSQTLFKLYLLDKTYEQIVEMYRGTPLEFSKSTLSLAAKKYKWVERKKEIIAKAMEESIETVQHYIREKYNMVHFLLDVTTEEMTKQWTEYKLNNGPRPQWIPNSIKEIDTLARLHDFIISGGAQKHIIAGKGDTTNIVNNVMVNDSNALNLLKALTDPTIIAEDLNLKEDPSVIDAEIDEAIIEDRQKWRKVKDVKRYKKEVKKESDLAEYSEDESEE